MSVLTQIPASFTNGKAVGFDDISLEFFESFPLRICAEKKENIETAAHESRKDQCILVACMDVKQAFDNVISVNVVSGMKELGVDATSAEAILGEQVGGKSDICFQETKMMCGNSF